MVFEKGVVGKETYLVSLCFFIYLEAQLLQGRLPSHLVLRARHLSQLAQSVMVGFLVASFPSLLFTTLQVDLMLLGFASVTGTPTTLILGGAVAFLGFSFVLLEEVKALVTN